MYVARALRLRDGDRARLEAVTRASTAPAGVVQRARIVLLAADGAPNTEIAKRTGSSRPTVLKWRGGYAGAGVDGLAHEPRPGRGPGNDEGEGLGEKLGGKGEPPAA